MMKRRGGQDDLDDDGPRMEMEFEPIVQPAGKSGKRRRRKPGWKILGVVAGLAVLSLGGAWVFLGGEHSGEEGQDAGYQVPVIHPDENPAKVKPEDPGGKDVPDRDKLVYDRLEGTTERSQVEHLLPRPESPLPPPLPSDESEAALPTDAPPSAPTHETQAAIPSAEEVIATPPPPPAPPPPVLPRTEVLTPGVAPIPPAVPVIAVEKGEPVPLIPRPTRPEPERSIDPGADEEVTEPPSPQVALAETPAPPAPAPASTPIPAVAPPPPPPPAPAPAAKPAAGRGHQVQIHAARSEEQAMDAWKALKKKHKDLLGALEPEVVRADLGAKGIYFRLRAGPLAGDTEARTLCGSLKERKVGCMVIAPGKN